MTVKELLWIDMMLFNGEAMKQLVKTKLVLKYFFRYM